MAGLTALVPGAFWQHAALMAIIFGLDPFTLDNQVEGSKDTARRMVTGVAAHDIYHAGQVSLLKRMANRSGR